MDEAPLSTDPENSSLVGVKRELEDDYTDCPIKRPALENESPQEDCKEKGNADTATPLPSAAAVPDLMSIPLEDPHKSGSVMGPAGDTGWSGDDWDQQQQYDEEDTDGRVDGDHHDHERFKADKEGSGYGSPNNYDYIEQERAHTRPSGDFGFRGRGRNNSSGFGWGHNIDSNGPNNRNAIGFESRNRDTNPYHERSSEYSATRRRTYSGEGYPSTGNNSNPSTHASGFDSKESLESEPLLADPDMVEKQKQILDLFQQFPRPLSTREVIKNVGKYFKAPLQPLLYDMHDRGLIIKHKGFGPQAWKLNPDPPPQPFIMARQRPPPPDYELAPPEDDSDSFGDTRNEGFRSTPRPLKRDSEEFSLLRPAYLMSKMANRGAMQKNLGDSSLCRSTYPISSSANRESKATPIQRAFEPCNGPPKPPHLLRNKNIISGAPVNSPEGSMISSKRGPPISPHMQQHIARPLNSQSPFQQATTPRSQIHTRPQIPPRPPMPPGQLAKPSPSRTYEQQQNQQQMRPNNPKSQKDPQLHMLSGATFDALNKNPVSALNELAQKNGKEVTFEILNQGKGFKNKFTVAAKVGERMFDAVCASNMKDARRDASDAALRSILGQSAYNIRSGGTTNVLDNIKNPPNTGLPMFDNIAALSHHAFLQLSTLVQEKFAGRKVIAAMIMQESYEHPGRVVALGTGNRCITGQRLSLEGKAVNDSHAEVITRRALMRFLYSELESFYDNKESIFEEGGMNSLLKLRDGVNFHLYISTAPCGDGALFTPREGSGTGGGMSLPKDHSPTFSSKPHGILRSKIEDGEGTIPIEPGDEEQTFDGILRGERLRTMSCSDKVCRWNVLGMQGALLSHLIEPIYLESLTLGYLFDHGHLSRAVCCRLDHKGSIDDDLPMPYYLNHPWIGRVTRYDASRETEKTNNISINWSACDAVPEVTDGRTGAQLTRSENAPTVSRLCKRELYKRFREVCSKKDDLKHLLDFETYSEAKSNATNFQKAKDCMFQKFRRSGFSRWVRKPREQQMFTV